jgi:sterol desaturase/sphingolipid hydroxylase (fatty acid hydroxylase superfamily)
MHEIYDLAQNTLRPFAEIQFSLDLLNIMAMVGILTEILYDLKKRRQRDYRETATNFLVWVPYYINYQIFGRNVFVFSCFYFLPYRYFSFEVNWLTWIACYLTMDFFYYWIHRWQHIFRWLWVNHNVHHSSTDFNFSANLRMSWLEFIFVGFFILPVIMIGFHIGQVLICLQIISLYQIWIHTKKIGKLPPGLEYVINTPSHHRVHHGTNDLYINKNFGGSLIIWDRLFKTFEPETEPVVYGIGGRERSYNPVTINFLELKNILTDTFSLSPLVQFVKLRLIRIRQLFFD